MINSNYNINFNKTSEPKEAQAAQESGSEASIYETKTSAAGDSVEIKNTGNETKPAEEAENKDKNKLSDQDKQQIQNDLDKIAERLSEKTDIPKETLSSLMQSEVKTLEKTFKNKNAYDTALTKLEYKYSKTKEKTSTNEDGSKDTWIRLNKKDVEFKSVNNEGQETKLYNTYGNNGKIKEKIQANTDGSKYVWNYDEKGNETGFKEYDSEGKLVFQSGTDENGEYYELDGEDNEITSE